MSGSILTLNTGSSSLKFAVFNDGLEPVLRGEIEPIKAAPRLVAQNAAGAQLEGREWPDQTTSFGTIIGDLLDYIERHSGKLRVGAVGHRIVHGGADFSRPVLISPNVLSRLDALTSLDPLHMPDNLACVHAVTKMRPGLPQVACFDTAFHQTIPPEAQAVAVPRALWNSGIRNYGFHGLSYEYIAGRIAADAPDLMSGRVMVAHLGAGASLCGLRNGVSIATTMGFSTLDGLMMATRCGTLDPGVIFYLARQGHSLSEIEDTLYHRSGLLGVSGISSDMRVLLASDNPRAAEAIALFNYRIAIAAGGMVSALGGLDGIVFTAGIGEHAAPIRAAVCERLEWLGVMLDAGANAGSATCISTGQSTVKVLVYPTDEEAMIARHTQAVISPDLLVASP